MQATRIALLVTAALAAPAFAAIDNYTVDLRRETGGLDIAANVLPGPVASVEVTNRSSSRVRCFVDFEGGRLTPARREAWLDPGTVATVNQRLNDPDIARLNVGLTCDALSRDEPIPPSNAFGQVIRGTNAPLGTGLPPATPVAPKPPATATPPAQRPAPGSGTVTVISPRN